MTRTATMNHSRMAACAFICAVVAALGVRAEGADDFVRVMNLGKAYLENRESAKAIETLNEAVKLDPKSAPAWRNLARAHLLAGKPDAALEALANAGGIEPETAGTACLTGFGHIRAPRFE